MMKNVFSFDMGSNSLGWAVVDLNGHRILGLGTRVFPEGVNQLGEGEKEISKNATRTEFRSARRQTFRRKLRKHKLLQLLAQNDMCPHSDKQLRQLKKDKQLFNHSMMKAWLKLNPYELRAKALNEKISLQELGRVFYHLIQRRGFLSNSRKEDFNEKSVINKGDKTGKTGIEETKNHIGTDSTLGGYLHSIAPVHKSPHNAGLKRIRNRYTTRQMYMDEFEKIWDAQSKFHTQLNDALKAVIGGRKKDGYPMNGVLFHQRPLKSQKHLKGKCGFETKKPRCPLSAISYEMFRAHQWVNTVEYNGKKLNKEQRKVVLDELLKKEKMKFSTIRKVLKMKEEHFQFNYEDTDQIVGTTTISKLSNKSLFGKQWFDFSEKQQHDIWHALYFFEDADHLKKYAVQHWGLSDEQAVKISRLRLKDGYANLSHKAINNILPFLEMGFVYSTAAALGGVKNAFGSEWHNLSGQARELIINTIPDIIDTRTAGGFIAELKSFLKTRFNLSDDQLKKLYHHSASTEKHQMIERLPIGAEADKELQKLRNPVVVAALFELRKLVNELIDRFGAPDLIKIELARELKNSKKIRNEIRIEQKRLEKLNDRVKKELEKNGKSITRNNIEKYKLWEECDKTCPYTSQSIGFEQLFNGEVEVEHILPYSKSLNNSFANKTLCFKAENQLKGNRSPYEFYSTFGEQKWEQLVQQALHCFKTKKDYPRAYNKFKHFIKKKYDDDFISRQLNDTRYMSREAKSYLTPLVGQNKVQVFAGGCTAQLRYYWGLNSILGSGDYKSRDDYRHHAIDALTVACTKQSHLQILSKWNQQQRPGTGFPPPWENFRYEAEKMAAKIMVSHKRRKKVLTRRNVKTKKGDKIYFNLGLAARGQLHKENVYGKRQPTDGSEGYHIRKPLTDIKTKKQLYKVVDKNIRLIILKRIEELGGFTGKDKNEIPKGTFWTVDENGNRQPQIFLPNKNGDPVVVKKVRITETFRGARKLKNLKQYVNLRNNHHILIYKDANGELGEDVVSFWEAVERKKSGKPIIGLADGAEGVIVCSLQINDFFLLGVDATAINWQEPDYDWLARHLYRVQKLSKGYYSFRKHTAASLKDKNFIRIQSFGKGKNGWLSHQPIKVKISVDGIIQLCNNP